MKRSKYNLLTRACLSKLSAWYVLGAVFFCVSGIGKALDISTGWKSGEIWKSERSEKWEDAETEDVDAHTSHIRKGSVVVFDDIVVTDTELTWKEDTETGEKTESETKKGAKKGKKHPSPESDKEEKAGKLSMITCDIMNRKNDLVIEEKEYEEGLKQCKAVLSKVSGVKPGKVRLASGKGATKQECLQWETEHGVARLIYAVTTLKGEQKKKYGSKRPEYIRLILAEKGSAFGSNAVLRDMHPFVVNDDDGTVRIKGIPMVEGEKGYCVPATLARVLTYYGISGADMPTLTALCDATSDGGISLSDMQEDLGIAENEYHLKLKQLSLPYAEHAAFLKDYLTAYKRTKKTEAAYPENPDDTAWLRSVDPKIWLKVRAKKAVDVNKWFNSIRSNVSIGIPVIWIVFASDLYGGDKKDADAGKEQMRIIIGYNLEKKQIVYSDCTGKHAEKRVMSIAEAYAMSSATYVIK